MALFTVAAFLKDNIFKHFNKDLASAQIAIFPYEIFLTNIITANSTVTSH
jgi:hypothetical protein